MLPCLDLALLDPPAQTVKARTAELLGKGVPGGKGKGKGGKGGKDLYPEGKGRRSRSVHRPVSRGSLEPDMSPSPATPPAHAGPPVGGVPAAPYQQPPAPPRQPPKTATSAACSWCASMFRRS